MTSGGDVRWEVAVCEGGSAFRWGRVASDYVAEWPGVLRLVADEHGNLKTLVAEAAALPADVEKIREGPATAFRRAVAGKPSLHASAVVSGGRALACIGPSGAGKSSVVAALCSRPRFDLLADDVAALEPEGDCFWVLPTESWHWLVARDAGEGEVKEARRARSVAREGAPLRVLVGLRFDDGLERLRVERVRGARAAELLLGAIMRFHAVPPVWMRELDAMTTLVAAARVYDLARPRSVTADDTAAALADLLCAEASP